MTFMLKKLVTWYINKYWIGEYYLKRDLEKTFEEIRVDEAAEQQREWSERLEQQRIMHEREMHIEKMRVENKIASLEARLAKALQRMRIAEDLQYSATTGAQRTLHTSANIKIKVCEIRDMLADLSGTLEGVEKDAHDNLLELTDAKATYMNKI